MANRLNVTELDFDSIKTNLKTFLRSQSEFTDYDFEGSGLNVLLDILAYNTHYNAYYLNMIANESFMDSALLRNSVVSHAKRYGYVPRSYTAPIADITLSVNSGTTDSDTLTIPAGYIFRSSLLDNKIYQYVTLKDYTVSKTDTNFVFSNLKIYEGRLLNYSFTQDDSINPRQIFTIPDSNIDLSTLKVVVRESSGSTLATTYNRVSDFITPTSTSEIFFIQEGINGQYEIYFGDGVIGKKVPNGGIVSLTVLTTSGDVSNGSTGFIGSASLSGYSTFSVITNSAASGGSGRETVDQIKFSAPLQYISQNRAVTKNDYVKLIQQKYPQFEAVNVWGGEENIPPVYGKVFVSAKPSYGFEVSETEKLNFIENVVKPISVLTVTPEFVDVDYNFIKLISTVYYDPTKTTLDITNLESNLNAVIADFSNLTLNKFNSVFRSSKLKTQIDNSDNSILSNELEIFLSKRFRPELETTNTYTLNFGIELQRGTIVDNFYSSPSFKTYDENLVLRDCFIEEIPSSFTGVESIQILTPGSGYTSTPTIEIVGDGDGAKATAIIVNGKLSSIKVTNPGIGYTTATVRIVGGNGTGATADAVLENRYGKIRIVYFKPDEVTNRSTKVVLNSGVNSGITGTIDYVLGIVTIENFNPIDVNNDFKELSINVRPKSTVINSVKNKMLAFDEQDPTSIVVNMKAVV